MSKEFKGSKLEGAMTKLVELGNKMLANGRFKKAGEFVEWINVLDELADGAFEAYEKETVKQAIEPQPELKVVKEE